MKRKKRNILGPANRMAAFIGDVVSAATVSPRGKKKRSAIHCWRRPRHKICPGHIIVCERFDGIIEWECSSCKTNGVIHGWQGGWSDLSDFRDYDEPPYFELVLTEQQYRELKNCTVADLDCDEIIYGATFSKQGIIIRACAVDMESLKLYLENKIKQPGNFNHRILLQVLTGIYALLGQWNTG